MGLWIKKGLWRNLDAREKDWPTAPQKQRFTYIEMLVMVISWAMRGQMHGLRKLPACLLSFGPHPTAQGSPRLSYQGPQGHDEGASSLAK